jgi:4-aminobutyrate aminotransferase-like enzyme
MVRHRALERRTRHHHIRQRHGERRAHRPNYRYTRSRRQLSGLTFATFGGNPVSAAAAIATIRVIEEEDLKHNAAIVGAYFHERLEELKTKHACIGDVRGLD